MDENVTTVLTNKKHIIILINNLDEIIKRCNTGKKQNKDHDKSDLIHFLLKTTVQQVLQSQIWNLK